MIELCNLSKYYRLSDGGRHYVFRDLNFSFPEGANIGLIGPNGAGKSTLLRLMGGIDIPDRGSVYTNKRISWPIGLSGGLQGQLSGRDNVKFVCRIQGTTHAEMLKKVCFVEEFAEIGEYFDQPIKTYSSGMRARLRFGLSWAFDFDYYLMDEVGAVGDARFKYKSRQLMENRISQSNIIMVSHSMDEIARLCNVVVLMDEGQATLYEDVDEGIRAYQELAEIDFHEARKAKIKRRLERLEKAVDRRGGRKARKLARRMEEDDGEN